MGGISEIHAGGRVSSDSHCLYSHGPWPFHYLQLFSVNTIKTMWESSYTDNNKILTVTTTWACIIKLTTHKLNYSSFGFRPWWFTCRFRHRLYFPLIWWAIHQCDQSHLICNAKITAEPHVYPNQCHSVFSECIFQSVSCRVCEWEGEKSSDRGIETENKTMWCMINDDKLHSLCKHNEFSNCNVIAFDLQNKLVMSTGSWQKYGKITTWLCHRVYW